MRVWVVLETGEFKDSVVGVYFDKVKAIQKQMEMCWCRSITECILE